MHNGRRTHGKASSCGTDELGSIYIMLKSQFDDPNDPASVLNTKIIIKIHITRNVLWRFFFYLYVNFTLKVDVHFPCHVLFLSEVYAVLR